MAWGVQSVIWLGAAGLIGLSGQPESRAAPVLQTTPSAQIVLGESLFNTVWAPAGAPAVARHGLGPLFNAASCTACHANGGPGKGPTADGAVPAALVIELQTPAAQAGAEAGGDPVYGRVFNTAATDGVQAEGVVTVRYQEMGGRYYPDGMRWRMRVPHYQLTGLTHGPLAEQTVIKPRLAPALFGAGLLEAVPASALGAAGDARVRGRFGWQGESVSIRDQTTKALAREMGLSTSEIPQDDCTAAEADCQGTPSDGGAEVPPELVDTTGTKSMAIIAPYTDLQLHDLGAEMADENAAGKKVPSLWRTAPLWGLGYRTRTESPPTFLHDGRARSLEEAILWHSGEAAPARRNFMDLWGRPRETLLRWLESL